MTHMEAERELVAWEKWRTKIRRHLQEMPVHIAMRRIAVQLTEAMDEVDRLKEVLDNYDATINSMPPEMRMQFIAYIQRAPVVRRFGQPTSTNILPVVKTLTQNTHE